MGTTTNASASGAPTLHTHIVLRQTPGLLAEDGQPAMEGELVDASMWRTRTVAAWEDTRRLKRLPSLPPLEAGRQAIRRAELMGGKLDDAERELKAEDEAIALRQAEIRKRLLALERVLREREELLREEGQITSRKGGIRVALERFPERRAQVAEERIRGEAMLRAAGTAS